MDFTPFTSEALLGTFHMYLLHLFRHKNFAFMALFYKFLR